MEVGAEAQEEFFLGKPCACCRTQMENGSRAWRCFPCDFHMCIQCHDAGGHYDKVLLRKATIEGGQSK